MTNIQQLNYKLNQQKNKFGLVGGTAKVREFDDAEYKNSTTYKNQSCL